MLNNIIQFLPLTQLRISAIALFVIFGMVGEQTKPALSSQITALPTSTAASTNPQANSFQIPHVTNSNRVGEHRSNLSIAVNDNTISPKVNSPQKDGIYLYGQSPQPDQIGQGYVLFQKRQGRLVGALYMPRSEFSCFQGTLEPSGELAMTVTGSPAAGEVREVATTSRVPNFSEDEPVNYSYSVALKDYHQINTISANDRRILQMCSR
ncbi:hypothetical protein [Nostoc sp. TCL26-01]|uniref:hypothetical protein n=1 Tax=Nostoc sp. TCL26-01 TaxID=2576904 RepID=UPI0015BF05A0|nr:hypothetical protein [Nostoc sp. TCL26-01]QLE55845.1 hypothetical protein FD725_10115 [Nostoc sp. TCL26-01]